MLHYCTEYYPGPIEPTLTMPIRTLIVDDEPHAIEVVKKYVSQIPEIELLATHNNAINAFQELQKNKVDLMFLDINMPIMNGWEFIESYNALKSDISKEIHICIVSSSVDDRDYLRSRNFPMVRRYFVKPLTPSLLIQLYDELQL